MQLSTAAKQMIHIVVVERDPLWSIGFRALLESEPDFELTAGASWEILMKQNINLVLLRDRPNENLVSRVSELKAMRADLPIIVIGSSTGDEAIFSAIASGAKGYVFDRSRPCELAQAIREVNQGSVWAPRRVISMFLERASLAPERILLGGAEPLREREKEVLAMLVAGLPNKEIGARLGIEERTVKAHIGKMLRTVGVHNRTEI